MGGCGGVGVLVLGGRVAFRAQVLTDTVTPVRLHGEVLLHRCGHRNQGLAFVPEALNHLRGLFLRGTRYICFAQEITPRGLASGDKSPNFPPKPLLYLTP